jgi:hypothetical protein
MEKILIPSENLCFILALKEYNRGDYNEISLNEAAKRLKEKLIRQYLK